MCEEYKVIGDRAGARDLSAPTKGQPDKLPIAPVTGTDRRARRPRDVLKINAGSGTPSADRDCSFGRMERSRQEDRIQRKRRRRRQGSRRGEKNWGIAAEEDATKNTTG